MPRFKLTVRLGIVVLLTAIVSIAGSIIILVSYLGGRNSVHFLVDEMMQNIANQVTEKTLGYLKPGITSLQLTRDLIGQELLNLSDRERLMTFFQSVLDANQQFEMLYLGDKSGALFMVKKMTDQTYSIKHITRDERAVFTEWFHTNQEWQEVYPSTMESLIDGYDSRRRPWFKRAVQHRDLIWTDVYIFYTDQQPGITSALPVFDKSQELQGVIGIDIGVAELSYFLGGLKIGEQGKAFILNQYHQLIAFPAVEAFDPGQIIQTHVEEKRTQYSFLPAEKIKDGEIAQSFKLFQEKLANLETTNTLLPRINDEVSAAEASVDPPNKGPRRLQSSIRFVYSHEGKNYLAMYAPFPQASGFDWLIGVVIPEEDVMALVNRNNQVTITLSLLLIGVAVVLGFVLSRNISQPLARLAQQMEQVKNFVLDFGNPVRSWLIEVDHMGQSFSNMTKGLRSFKKYVPADLVRELIALEQEAVVGGENRHVTVFFSDVVGFTSIAEQMTPQGLVNELSRYLSHVSHVIHQHQGTVDKYIGDGVMALWGAPRVLEDHALCACRAALQVQEKVKELPFQCRIGINTGDVVLGNIGVEDRINYTAVGEHVNLASRLEDLNKYYGTLILVSETTYEAVQDRLAARLLDFVAVRGSKRGVAIYELIGERDQLTDETKHFLEQFTQGVRLYQDRGWSQALECFENTHQLRPDDVPTRIFIHRCLNYLTNPPSDDWTGIVSFDTHYEAQSGEGK